MKKSAFFVLVMITLSICSAQNEVPFPPGNPLIKITIPDDWTYSTYYEDTMIEILPEDESIIYMMYILETPNFLEAVQRINQEAEVEFDEHDLSNRTEEEINGILFHKYWGSGLTSDYDYYNFHARIFKVDNSNFFMIYYSGMEEDAEYYEIDIDYMNYSIKKY